MEEYTRMLKISILAIIVVCAVAGAIASSIPTDKEETAG